MNPVEIADAVSELVEQPFDAAEFPFQFLTAFGNKKTTIDRLRKGSTNQSDINGGVLQRSNIHIATCAAGATAKTLAALRESPKTASQKAKFILATDGEQVHVEDLTSGELIVCEFMDLVDHFGVLLPLAGVTTVAQIKESTIDIRATGKLNKLYTRLREDNPDWENRREDMNHFMARLIFCFFAEDTDIFHPSYRFTETVAKMSGGGADNTAEVIQELFRSMNTPIADRKTASIKSWADGFPYVNGELFSGSIDVPYFSGTSRGYLTHIGGLDWTKINPDIFGSMIQAVADDEERGALGMHYTSVPNILKVLNPLFLDDLRAKLEEAGSNGRKLANLRSRMSKIRVFDPACGSGNFLVIAYKQMREIEAEINRRRGEPDRKTDIPKTNFRGIELRNFPAEIARLALIIAEYQCDVLYRGQKEALAEFLPLDSENWITCGNALRLDWLNICPPTGTSVKVTGDDLFETPLNQSEIDFANAGGETYVCGNPPYVWTNDQDAQQKADLQHLFEDHTRSWRSLNYVSGWFLKLTEYNRFAEADGAFVAVNTICQGQHAILFWPIILADGNRICFAQTDFKWQNLASNNAGVTVVVVGLSRSRQKRVRLYTDEGGDSIAVEANCIGPYLVPNIETVIRKQSSQISTLGDMLRGNMPYEGGHLLLSMSDKDEIIAKAPEARKFIGRISGSSEIIDGKPKYCIWIENKDVEAARRLEPIAERLAAVRRLREANKDPSIVALAETPHRFREMNVATERLVAMPAVSSERRDYLPAELLSATHTITNRAYGIFDGTLVDFAVLASRLHIVWVGTVCGRLERRYSYTNTLGWNTFPLPKLTEQNKTDLTHCAENILFAREAHFPATIADLYDPEAMDEKYPDLRHAHDENDEVLERIYIGRRFRNDTERLEKLFELYTKMTSKKAA